MILLDEQLSRSPSQIATIEEAADIIDKLEYELINSNIPGIGLAAPQIGIDKAVAIIRINNPLDATNLYSINLVNPKLISVDGLMEYNEGCLSFPGLHANTIRFSNILLETNSDYEYYSAIINSKRYNTDIKLPNRLSAERRLINVETLSDEHPKTQELSKLLSVCIQHEFSHLLGLTMFDFIPEEVGRNDKCPCNSQKKNKKCHNYTYYNKNLNKLFSPDYRSI